jgi:hypothetical protein
LQVRDRPDFSVTLGCDGDSAATCDDLEDEADFARNQAELRKDVRRLERAKLRNRAFVRRAAARDAGAPSAHTRCAFEDTDAGVVGLASEKCDKCGQAEALLGTPFLYVYTDWDQGDFMHEFYELYDTRDGRFFDPTQPTRRSAKPFPFKAFEEDTAYTESKPEISPTCHSMVWKSYLVDVEHGKVAKVYPFCGWLRGSLGFGGGDKSGKQTPGRNVGADAKVDAGVDH